MAAEEVSKICINDKHLLAARDILRETLKNSRALTRSVDETRHRLDEFRPRLHSLEADLRPNNHLKEHFNWAVGPIDAVVKALQSVHRIETSLTSALTLSTYISTVKRLEEALGFLTNSCTLALQWLNGTVEFLQGDVAAREMYIDRVNNCLRTIEKFQAAAERSRLRGGTLDVALTNLEDEFTKIVERHTLAESHHLQAIIERLSSNERLEKCVSVFIEIRTRHASETLRNLGLDYLDEDVDRLEASISKWKQHMVLAVTEVLETEYFVCEEVFDTVRGGGTRCFFAIAHRSGFCKFLQFGIKVAEEGKKSPNQLLNLLGLFSILDDLRPSFSRLFGGDGCREIQDSTRDLVKKVVEGCWEIFWELSYQVELQRETDPPSDGGVPRLVSFVTDYCNQLLGDDYRASMIQVLMIYQSWKREKYQEGLFSNQLYNIMKQIGLNLDSWSKLYEDRVLSYLFMMNNHTHLCSLRGTKIEAMMGESWLKAHQQYRDNYAILYVKESWGKISVSEKDTDENLRTFQEMFERVYQKHLQWSIPDEKMRVQVVNRIVEAIVTPYRSCLLKRHGGDSWQVSGRSSRNGNGYSKIMSAQAMEDRIRLLFQRNVKRKGVSKEYLMAVRDKIVNVLADRRYSMTLTAS